MSNRDDFYKKTKEIAAKRVGYLCSCPSCRLITISASAEGNDSYKNVGEAAHICAAAKGGKRYDENMSTAERRSIDNCLWLCSYHARLIDRDESIYTIELLKQWKKEAEEYAMARAETVEKMTNDTAMIIEWYEKLDIANWTDTASRLLNVVPRMLEESRDKIVSGLIWFSKNAHLFSPDVFPQIQNHARILETLINRFDEKSEEHCFKDMTVLSIAPWRYGESLYSTTQEYSCFIDLVWELTLESTKALNDVLDMLRSQYVLPFAQEKVNVYYTTDVTEGARSIVVEYDSDENRVFDIKQFIKDPKKRLKK